MPTPHPGLGLPTSIDRSSRRRGCGCCSHCQCTGSCVEVEYSPDMTTILSYQSKTPAHSRSPSPLPPPTTSSALPPHLPPRKGDFLSVMENVAHPGDAVSLSRKTSRNNVMPEAQQPLTPAVASRRDGALSRSNSGKNGTSNERDKEKDKSSRYRDGKTSRPASPDVIPVDEEPATARRDQSQEEYEANYKTRLSRRHHRRLESDVEIRAYGPSEDEEGDAPARVTRRKERNGSRKAKTHDTEGEEYSRELRRKDTTSSRKDKSYEEDGEGYAREQRRKDRNESRKDRTYDENIQATKDTERSRRKQQHRENADEESRYRAKGAEEGDCEERRVRKAEDREKEKESRYRAKDKDETDYEEKRGRKVEDREKESRARSKSRPREPVQTSTDNNVGNNWGQEGTATSGHNRSKSRNDPVEYLQNKIDKIGSNEFLQNKIEKIGSKRELIKELIKQSAPIPVNQLASPNLHNNSATHVDIARGIEVNTSDDNRFGSWNAIRKLSVHVASDYGLMLHFLDWCRRSDSNEPLVAFRLEDGEQGSYEKKSGGLFSKKPGPDWLQESHETGAKVKGRLCLGVGIKGPVLYHIDVKRRKVDKFVITGALDHASDFKDDPHYGSHDDYRHVYFETPEGLTMKWFLAEPGKLMRLYGRGEKDYGTLYAEARMQKGDTKKNKRGKEVQIFFYDPNHPEQPRRMDNNDKNSGDVDFAFICASWWCARQTFDESRLVEAHAEVELIENIEKAFEVDLLAGA